MEPKRKVRPEANPESYPTSGVIVGVSVVLGQLSRINVEIEHTAGRVSAALQYANDV
jgi:hypothetical protein